MHRVQEKVTSSKWPDLKRFQELVFCITFENTRGNLIKRRMGLLSFDGNSRAGPSPSPFEVSDREMAISLSHWQFHEAPVKDWHPRLVQPGFKLGSNHRSGWFPECGSCSWDRSRGTPALPVYHHPITPAEQGSHRHGHTFSQPGVLWEARGTQGILLSAVQLTKKTGPGLFYPRSNSRLNAPLTAVTCASPHISIWREDFTWRDAATWKPLSAGCGWVFIPGWNCFLWLLNTATSRSYQDNTMFS